MAALVNWVRPRAGDARRSVRGWRDQQTLWPSNRRAVAAWGGGSVAVVAMSLLTGGDYDPAQRAASATDFIDIVGDRRWAFLAAGALDFVFVACYAVAALSLTRLVAGNPNRRGLVRLGAGLVVAAAALDLLENLFVIVNLWQFDVESIGWTVYAMRSVGSVKRQLVGFGVTIELVALAIAMWWPNDPSAVVRFWIRRSRWPFFAYLGLVVTTVLLAALHQRAALVYVALPALAACGHHLNGVVRQSRADVGALDEGPARLLLALVQLMVGVVVASVAWSSSGSWADAGFVLGLALTIMALGALVSELRQNHRAKNWRGPLLMVLALCALIVAALAPVGGVVLVGLAAGLVFGVVGTELASEDLRRGAPDVGALARIGAVLVVLGVAWLLCIGTGLTPLLGLVVVLAMVVVMASADGDALAIVLVIAVAIVWATEPRDASPSAERLAVSGQPYILVLGDSYMSGEGAAGFIPGTNVILPDGEDDADTNECRRAPTAWPFVLADRVATAAVEREPHPDIPTRLLFVACSGAVAEDITDEGGVAARDRVSELALFEEARAEFGPGADGSPQQPALVIVGIGGNDGGFGDLGRSCVGPGDCSALAQQFFFERDDDDRSDATELFGIADELGGGDLDGDGSDDLGVYERIRDSVGPGVPILATSYPVPVTTDEPCRGVTLTTAERAFIQSFASALNGIIEREVVESTDPDLHFGDISDALTERGAPLCSAVPGAAGLNFVALSPVGGTIRDGLNPKNWVHNSLHPNAVGHAALADEAFEWFTTHWPSILAHKALPVTNARDLEAEARAVVNGFGPQCIGGDRCGIASVRWTAIEAQLMFRGALPGLALLVVSLWLLLGPQVVRDDGWVRRRIEEWWPTSGATPEVPPAGVESPVEVESPAE